MKHAFTIGLIILCISCSSKKTTILSSESIESQIPDIDLSDYIMVCFSNKYLQENEIRVPKNGSIYSTKNAEHTCVDKKDYIIRHLIEKAYYGDEKAIDLIILIHKSLNRVDHINVPSYYTKIRGDKLFNYYYQRFQSNPCQKVTEECQSSYVALNDFVQMIRMIDHINGQDPSEYIDNNLSPNITLKSKIENCNDTHYQNHIAMLETINNALAKDWVKLKEFGQ